MTVSRVFKSLLVAPMLVLVGCGLLDDSAIKKSSNSGLIATPVSYYSTSRARYLGAKYKENLDRLVERISRNPKTANLQFANNIASVGGIGFFTHSATKTADERYLEVVLAAPETFETKGAHSDKLNRLFILYGADLLATLSGDNEIYQDKELTGYALNLSWRNAVVDPVGNRVALERAIVYLSKEKSRKFLRREINQQELLADATIFAVEEDGPLNLISYRAPEVHQEYRPMIREDDISPGQMAAKPAQVPAVIKTEALDQGKKDPLPLKEPVAKVAPTQPAAVAQKNKPSAAKAPVLAESPTKSAAPAAVIAAPIEIPVGDAVPAEVAKTRVPVPSVSTNSDTQKVTATTQPVTQNHAVISPYPVVELKITPQSPVDVDTPAIIAPRLARPAAVPPAILAPPSDSAGLAQLIDNPNESPIDVNRFLSPEPLATTSVSAPEPPNVEKSVPAPSIVKSQANPTEILSAPVNLAPVRPNPLAEVPVLPSPHAATPPTGGTPERSAVITSGPNADANRIGIVSASPDVVKPAPHELPVEPLPLVSTQPGPSLKPGVVAAPARSVAPAPTLVAEKNQVKPVAEQLASLANKPIEAAPIAKPVGARPAAPKPLEGFIIQLAFNDKERAQHWAEGMEKKGFAISITEAGSEGALRVRLGNFVLRDDAERQLKAIKQEGLSGIILNLPQAFRPEARTSVP